MSVSQSTTKNIHRIIPGSNYIYIKFIWLQRLELNQLSPGYEAGDFPFVLAAIVLLVTLVLGNCVTSQVEMNGGTSSCFIDIMHNL